MKTLPAIVLCLGAMLNCTFGQGLIKFQNSTTTLISAGGLPISEGTYYFALLSAPAGTTDQRSGLFEFTGLYATNTATPGRLQGGSLLGVAANSTWGPVTTRSFFVVGWSADAGPTFNADWLRAGWPPWPCRAFGFSAIATGMSGGTDPITGLGYAALPVFSGLTISTGFDMSPIPEPTTGGLMGALAAAWLIWKRRRRSELERTLGRSNSQDLTLH